MLCQCLFERLSQLQIDKDRSVIVAKFGTDFQVLAFFYGKVGNCRFCVCSYYGLRRRELCLIEASKFEVFEALPFGANSPI